MNKSLVGRTLNYFSISQGQSYRALIYYGLPELITSFLLFALPVWIDSYFISFLGSTPAYATLGTTNNTLHLIVKMSEAFSVSTVILIGYFNGLSQFSRAGQMLKNILFLTMCAASVISALLFVGAPFIFSWLGVTSDIAQLGIPFLRIKAIGLFFSFMTIVCIGFFRGIKDTQTPLYIYSIGTAAFILIDYLLIFGTLGSRALGFYGSAWAFLVQSITMFLTACLFMIRAPECEAFVQGFFQKINSHDCKKMAILVWPIILDKAILAFAYIWLSKMINSMGLCASASFCAIKDLERFAFLPAIAGAQVITFLVSNDFGRNDWPAIQSNIKKVMIISGSGVFLILGIFASNAQRIVTLFDKNNDFSTLTVQIFPLLSVLVFFDLVQLLLAAALRGSGQVKLVMWTRICVCIGYFMPISYVLANYMIASIPFKFLCIYSSFYFGNAIMSLVYILRLRTITGKLHTL